MSNNISRTKKFFYSTVTTGLYQMVLFVSGLILPRFMLQYYGSEINGVVSSINQFIIYFNLVEAGLSGASIYALYKPLAEHDESKISSIVSGAKKFYYKAGFLFVSLATCLAIIYPLLVRSEKLNYLEITLLTFVLGCSSVIELFSLAKYRALLSADQKTYIISIASIIHVILNTAIICTLATLSVNIVILRAIALLSVFARTGILVIYVKRKYPFINYNAKSVKSLLNKRWDAMYMQIIGAIHTGAPIMILTVVVKDLLLVSVFSIYNMIVTGLHGVMSIFSSGLSASFGDVIVKKEQKILESTYQQFELGYLSIMTVIYSVAMVMIMSFIKIYTNGITDTNYFIPMIGILIIINGFLYNLKSPQAMILIAAGLYKESRLQTTIQGAIMLVLGCILGYKYKIEGVLVACIISNLYRDIDLLFFIPKHVTKLPVINTLKRWISMVVCFLTITTICRLMPINPTGYIGWMMWACLVGVIAVIIVLINAVLSERDNFIALFKRVKAVIIK